MKIVTKGNNNMRKVECAEMKNTTYNTGASQV